MAKRQLEMLHVLLALRFGLLLNCLPFDYLLFACLLF